MSTNLQMQSSNEAPQGDGGVWYRLRSEREEICEALLREAPASVNVESFLPKPTWTTANCRSVCD